MLRDKIRKILGKNFIAYEEEEAFEHSVADLTTFIEGLVPEKETNLCYCTMPDTYLNHEHNMIWCEICDKQFGSMSWNAAIDKMHENMGI